MFVLGNLVSTLAELVNILLWGFKWLIIIRALISWVNPDPFNPIVQFLLRVTEPVLEPVRRIVPPIGGIDISPILVLLVLHLLQSFLVKTLVDLGVALHR